MKKQLQYASALLLLLLTTSAVHAQWDDGLWVGKQANNWIFYGEAGLNFNTSPPTINPNAVTTNYCQPYSGFGTGAGTISNTNGNLLFSVSLDSIWNKNYQFMNNGDGILTDPGASGMQVGLTVPVPGPSNEYYIFSKNRPGNGCYDGSEVAGIDGINTLVYSIVDMDLDNGLGAVTAKNIILDAPMDGKITAVYHANGEDVWVIGHGGTSLAPDPADQQYNAFYAYLVTENGISPPVISTIGIPLDINYGQLKASPDGSKIAYVNGIAVLAGTTVNLEVFDFNNATGVVSNPIDLSSAMGAMAGWGLEFSPNSRYLYVTEPGYSLDFSRLHQFDLEAGGQAAILASDVLLAEITPAVFNSLQLAPNGKIYMANYTGYVPDPPDTGAISVIHYPNNAGMTADFEHLAVPLSTKCGYGLPSFIQSYFESGILHEGNDCTGYEVAFSTLRIPGIESVDWDFGDPDSGTDNSLTTTDGNAAHIFSGPGTYTVTASITSNGAQQTATTEIEVIPLAEAFPAEDQLVCGDNTGSAIFDLTQQNAVVLGNQEPNIHTVSYHTTQNDAENNTNPITNLSAYTSSGETIFARVTSPSGCYAITSFDLVVPKTPKIPASIELKGCSPIDLTEINTKFPQDYLVTYYEEEQDAQNKQDSIPNIESYVFAGREKWLWVRVENATGTCNDIGKLILQQGDCSIPQGISPNGDAFNQNFDLSYMNIQNLEIFNRYGRSVYNKESYTNQWFGQTDNGDELPTGTYFYVIKLEEGQTFQNKNVLTGWVYVQREVN